MCPLEPIIYILTQPINDYLDESSVSKLAQKHMQWWKKILVRIIKNIVNECTARICICVYIVMVTYRCRERRERYEGAAVVEWWLYWWVEGTDVTVLLWCACVVWWVFLPLVVVLVASQRGSSARCCCCCCCWWLLWLWWWWWCGAVAMILCPTICRACSVRRRWFSVLPHATISHRTSSWWGANYTSTRIQTTSFAYL